MRAGFLILYLFSVSLQTCLGEGSFYDLTARDSSGGEVSLDHYKGKVSLVVNVASQCGYTDTNYKALVQLQQDFSSEGFTVLAFPCNQFGEQEPGSMSDILEFSSGYNANFPIFSKIDVSGNEASAVYQHLYQKTRSVPEWNFSKYLVDRTGTVRQFFSEKGDFAAIRLAISYLLKKSHSEL